MVITLSWYCLRLKKEAIVALNEEVNLYKETLSVKDHVVMELTNKVLKSSYHNKVHVGLYGGNIYIYI